MCVPGSPTSSAGFSAIQCVLSRPLSPDTCLVKPQRRPRGQTQPIRVWARPVSGHDLQSCRKAPRRRRLHAAAGRSAAHARSDFSTPGPRATREGRATVTFVPSRLFQPADALRSPTPCLCAPELRPPGHAPARQLRAVLSSPYEGTAPRKSSYSSHLPPLTPKESWQEIPPNLVFWI